MTDIQLPPLPDNLPNVVRRIRACEGEIAAQVVFECALNEYARAAIEAEKLHTDNLLRSSVPERWKSCASSVGAVQSYIAELEAAIEAHEARKASQWRSAAQNALIWMESAWERIDGEWGPCGKTLDQLCAEGEEPEIEALRSLLASAPPAPQASKKPLFGELIAQHKGLAEELQATGWSEETGLVLDAATSVELACYEQGTTECLAAVTRIIDGKDDGSGVAREPWESVRRRLIAMVEQARAVKQEPVDLKTEKCLWARNGHARCPAPISAPVREPLTPEHAEVLKLMVNSNRLAPIESTALCNAITALGITKDTPKPRRKASADFDLPAPNDNIGDKP